MDINIKRRITINVILGIIFIVIFYITLLVYKKITPEGASGIDLLTLLALIVAAFTYLQSVNYAKKEQTIIVDSEIINNFDFEEKLKKLKTLHKTRESCQYCSLIRMEEFTKHYSEILSILKKLEWYSNGVYHKLYDENYLFSSYASTLVVNFERTIPFILLQQEKQDRAYIKFCWLASKWVLKRKLDPKEKGYIHLKVVHSKIEEYIFLEYDDSLIAHLGKKLYRSKILKHQDTSKLLKDAQHALRKYYESICTQSNTENCWLKKDCRTFKAIRIPS